MIFLEELFTFIGRWHPLLVHLPIGILIFAFVMALVDRFTKKQDYHRAICLALLLGAAAAVIAGITGYLLSRDGGYQASTLIFHQFLGIAVALASILTFFLYRAQHSTKNWIQTLRRQRFLILLIVILLLGFTGHFGGTLTHGEGYMKNSMPTALKKTFGIAEPKEEILRLANAQEAIVYKDIVQPILKQRCQSCHGEKKQEGGLALHTQEGMLKGGESGILFVRGDTTKSELYSRLVLPEGHKKRMPPKGRTPITPDQIKLISWWISSGADFEKQTKDIKQPKDILAILTKLENGDQQQDASLYANLPAAPSLPRDKVKAWKAKGLKIMPVAEGSNLVVINAVNYPSFNDQDVQDILRIKENIVQLKIGGTAISDQGMKSIAQLPLLHRLHLENTAVTDVGLTHLNSLKNLMYINLVGTAITDKAVALLREIPQLKHVYAFNTEIHGNDASQNKGKARLDTGNYYLPVLESDTIIY